MHTFSEEWRGIVVFWEQHRVQIKGKVQGRKLGSVKRYFMRNVFFSDRFPCLFDGASRHASRYQDNHFWVPFGHRRARLRTGYSYS